jgi:hypothetical protein
MVDFKKLSTRAKDLVEQRGGTEGLKKDAATLREVAKSKGTLSDKAKAAAAALKETSANDPAAPAADSAPPPEAAPKPDPAAPSEAGVQLDADAADRNAADEKSRNEQSTGAATNKGSAL